MKKHVPSLLNSRQWVERLRPDGQSLPPDLAQSLGVSEPVARLLWQRAVCAEADPETQTFLNPGLRHLASPDAFPGVSLGARLLVDSLLQGRQLAIWGDYDVDGVTGAALCLEILRFHGFDPLWHIPERSEGYGLNIPALEQLASQGAQALLTVDCGISDLAAVQRAKQLGLLVVISDHHLPPQELPPADALCNPKLGPSPCRDLAGVGVAFFLLAKVNQLLSETTGRKYNLRDCLDLAALGTLADMVPLLGQNRILAKNGMILLAEAKRPGLAELKQISGYQAGAKLGAEQIVFSLAPRLNAAGRMSHSAVALDLLLTTDREQAAAKARELDRLNSLRRATEDEISSQASSLAEQQQDNEVLLLVGQDWNQGVIGIVASRVAEKHHKPVIILTNDGDDYKGSCRSVPGFDIHAALSACSAHLSGFGGHSMAAGLRLPGHKLPDFELALRAYCADHGLVSSTSKPPLLLDGYLDFQFLSNGLVFMRELDLLQPFGQDNPEPVFASPICRVENKRLFGPRKDHVLLDLRDEGTGCRLNAKAWNQAEHLTPVSQGRKVQVAFCPVLDMYNGIANLELRLRDLRLLD